jgi:acyl-CoA thioester hydrolase
MSSPTPFELVLRVEDADIDRQGHVNNLVYLRWAQDVATAHWQSFASKEDDETLLWVVMRHEIDYMAPALLGDELRIRTWIGKAKGLTFERHTEIVRAADEQTLARARTLWCPLSTRTGRPQRISASLRAQFSALEQGA